MGTFGSHSRDVVLEQDRNAVQKAAFAGELALLV